METTETAAPRLRIWRAFVAALLAEVGLTIIAGAMYAAMADAGPALNVVVPPASLVLFLAAGYWSAKPIPNNAIWQGVITGVWAVGLYILLGVVAGMVSPEANVSDGFTGPYLAAHVLKVVGAAIGGWLVARKAGAQAAP
jgi:hypothetical protein